MLTLRIGGSVGVANSEDLYNRFSDIRRAMQQVWGLVAAQSLGVEAEREFARWENLHHLAPPHLLHTAEAVFDLAVAHGMSRAGHTHTGRALCTVVVGERCLVSSKTSEISKTATPTNHLPSPAPAPSAGSITHAEYCRDCI